VIGLPGESVTERGGFIYINGKTLNEPYIAADRRDHEPPRAWHVPPDAYFLLGDNRAESCDSRVFGSVPATDIIGRVVRIIRTR
jgi:signal peptidase I